MVTFSHSTAVKPPVSGSWSSSSMRISGPSLWLSGWLWARSGLGVDDEEEGGDACCMDMARRSNGVRLHAKKSGDGDRKSGLDERPKEPWRRIMRFFLGREPCSNSRAERWAAYPSLRNWGSEGKWDLKSWRGKWVRFRLNGVWFYLLYLTLVLVFFGWSSHDVDLRGVQAQCAVHGHVLHRAVRCTDLNVTLQHARSALININDLSEIIMDGLDNSLLEHPLGLFIPCAKCLCLFSVLTCLPRPLLRPIHSPFPPLHACPSCFTNSLPYIYLLYLPES